MVERFGPGGLHISITLYHELMVSFCELIPPTRAVVRRCEYRSYVHN